MIRTCWRQRLLKLAITVAGTSLMQLAANARAACPDDPDLFGGGRMRVEVLGHYENAIDPFDRHTEWTRLVERRRVAGATMAVLHREVRQHFGPYYGEGLDIETSAQQACPEALVLATVANLPHGAARELTGRMKLTELGPESAAIFTYGRSLYITSETEAGVLRGFYGLLDALGFRFYAPDAAWDVKPSRLAYTKPAEPVVLSPRIERRGFWWSDSHIDDAFLLWVARNRFNLIGSGDYNVDLAKSLGIRLWGGGHHVIGTILNPDNEAGGGTLRDRHPSWYASRVQQGGKPRRWAELQYPNPCLLDTELIAYFSDVLRHELVSGDYASVDILNIWPSDEPQMYVDTTCSNPERYQNPSSVLMGFLKKVAERVGADLPSLDEPIVLAGISYYDTWQIPDADALKVLEASPSRLRLEHYFYLNERSFSTPLMSEHAGTWNTRIRHRLGEWTRDLAKLKMRWGIVEYYNYSVHASLPGIHSFLVDDAEAYAGIGASLLSYMHVVRGEMGPWRLTNRLLARSGWGATSTSEVRDDYFRGLYGPAAARVGRAYARLERALSGIKEMLSGQSTLTLQTLRLRSAKGTSRQEKSSAIARFLAGGPGPMPALGRGWMVTPPVEADFIGLDEALAEISGAIRDLEASRDTTDRVVSARIGDDLVWFRYARDFYLMLRFAAQNAAGEHVSRWEWTRLQMRLSQFPHRKATVAPIDTWAQVQKHSLRMKF